MMDENQSSAEGTDLTQEGESDAGSLIQSNRFQQALIDSSVYSIISTDLQGIILYFNKAASRMLGYQADDVVRRHTPELFHDRHEIEQRARELSQASDQRVLPGFEVFIHKARLGQYEEREWTFIRKDGSRFPVLLTVTEVRDPDGKPLGYNGVAIDITRRVLIERELRDQEDRYRQLIEAASDTIFLLEEGIIQDCNSTSMSMFGCERKQQLIGLTLLDLSVPVQPGGELSEQVVNRWSAPGDSQPIDSLEWRHRRFDNSAFDAEVRLTSVTLGGKRHQLAIVRDISQRKLIAEELQTSRQKLMMQNENLRLINDISDRLHGTQSINSAIDSALKLLLEFSGCDQALLFSREEHSDQLRLTHLQEGDPVALHVGECLPAGSLNGEALRLGVILYSDNIAGDERIIDSFRQKLLEKHVEVVVVVPLIYQHQHIGTLDLLYLNAHEFDPLQLDVLETVAKNLTVALINARHMERLKYIASHDELTHLCNRSLLHSAFEQYVGEGMSEAVFMLLDLDRFKEINDTLGHHVGDLLLQQIGPRIDFICHDVQHLTCRLGGDEFALLLVQPNWSKTVVIDFALRIQQELHRPYNIDDMHLEADASIGIAFYPEDGANSHELLRSADVAMYNAKNRGAGVAVYQQIEDEHSRERLALASELSRAIELDQLELYYQPKISLANVNANGFEALVRWRHPQHGLLSPDYFLPQAEVSDAIHHLTVKVLDLALKQQQQWRQLGYTFTVAVNLSARNLVDDRLLMVLRELLSKYQTPHRGLELEITETALMQDTERAITMLTEFSALGIALAIDDFGTGYSSLNYIRQLPVDTLKIDRVFVTNMMKNEADQVIVRSTIGLAHNLNLQVVAEGIEDQATLNLLNTMQCDYLQGYFIGQPLATKDTLKWLQRGPQTSMAQ